MTDHLRQALRNLKRRTLDRIHHRPHRAVVAAMAEPMGITTSDDGGAW